MTGAMRVAMIAEAAMLLLAALPASGQKQWGEVTSTLSGSLSPGYTADFSNQGGSDHSWTVGGIADYSGSYYNPNFLSFNAGLYLNQSRANSNFQSISNASGINASASIFSGSRFPGSFTYSKAYDSQGNYDVPGVADFVTHGNSQSLGISWNESIPGAPSFGAGYQLGDSDYSVYGSNASGANKFHSLNLRSAYTVAGFGLSGSYSTGGGTSTLPAILSSGTQTENHASSDAFGFGAGHSLPMQGSLQTILTRTSWNNSYLGNTSTGSVDVWSTNASLHPTEKLSMSGSVGYSDNLSGQLYQQVLSAGGVVPELNSNVQSHSLDMQAVIAYSLRDDLQGSALVERRAQSFLGENYGDDIFGVNGSYSHNFLGGHFNSALGVMQNIVDGAGESSLGLSANANYSGEIRGWGFSGSFNYGQNVQTLLVSYMNSVYSYSGNARRRWGKVNVSGGASASRTGLTQQGGTVSSSQGYNFSLGYNPWVSATGTYNKSSGQALQTGAGLVPVVGPTPLPSSLILYGGSGYSFSLSSTPVKKLSVSASYASASSNTNNAGVASSNQFQEFNTYMQYQTRKIYYNSGYSRLEQGFSGSGNPPQVVSSVYVGLSRWFNVF